MPVRSGDLVCIQIQRLAAGGAGVGRIEDSTSGLVVFVPFTAPGDKIEARVSKVKKNYAEADLVRVLSPGPSRSTPPCAIYSECGGCNWQHVDYDEQLRQKESIVREAFRRAHLTPTEWQPIVSSPQNFHYRNRIQLHRISGKIGFRRRRSHELVEVKTCWIADEDLNAKIPEVRKEGEDSRIEILKTPNQEVKIVETFSAHSSLGFSQVNSGQNQNLISATLKSLADAPKTILDLFCGSGNFTFPLKKQFPKARVVGVDLNEAGINLARSQNAFGIEFLCENVVTFFKRDSSHFDLILMDPPRQGCPSEVLEPLSKANFKELIYISCNPQTLVRDLKSLLRSTDEIAYVQPFDMFPQTDHVEVFVRIRREAH